ncbi:response regulator transcription factor [Alkalicella caledoniensis]|uniref:Stage 0 sporulation protein A homolog n=1 Tax=Alkalicella caledoniensis TaxID=2731377 RepID=A0A7G9W7E2_ALKCA|nr:response regulator transcription factor [Alkalicella caledoniensis]QNO14604.1 response regulator transcription factor [Alkalicella caledoniensis]
MKKEVINVLIADDHDIIRQGLKTIISFQEGLNICGEAENGEKALALVKATSPDVILLDINMPMISGIEVLRNVKDKTDIKVIMLTIENDRKTIHTAIDIGADGYVLKDTAGTEIINAIRAVSEGEKYIDKTLVSLLFSNIQGNGKKSNGTFENLTKREMEVLCNISKGLSNKEIGSKLFLTEKTVKNYATSLFRKINVDDRVQATIFALENNIEEYKRNQ